MNKTTRTVNVQDLAVARTFGGGWLVFVRGAVLRATKFGRPHNERHFTSQEAALIAGSRAWKRGYGL